MRGNMSYQNSYGFFFFFLLILFLTIPSISLSSNTLSSTESLTISSNRTIVSPGGVFEFGFFQFDSNTGWYLGIWYKKVPLKTYVWFANRDKPLSNSTGILKILDADLVLLDQSNTPVWSSANATGRIRDSRSSLVGELLDNGNFVLRETDNKKGEDGYLWESFDFPTDTLLPQMTLGVDPKREVNKFLKAWKSPNDPSFGTGNFMYELGCQGFPAFYVTQHLNIIYRNVPWNGTGFNGYVDQETCTFTLMNDSIYSRLTIDSEGNVTLYNINESSWKWHISSVFPNDACDEYESCGAYEYCDLTTSPVCNCIKGFNRKNPWDDITGENECSRTRSLNCRGDMFVPLKNMMLPSTDFVDVLKQVSLEECENKCLADCECTAFAITYTKNGGRDCVTWIGKLYGIRNQSVGGQDLYVRVAASELEPPKEEKNKMGIILGSVAGGIVIILVICLIFYIRWTREQNLAMQNSAPPTIVHEVNTLELLRTQPIIPPPSTTRDNNSNDFQLPKMEFTSLVVATNNFSEANKLGQGGFGGVYKGRLCNGEEIAVKRLSNMSSQGDVEFNNEVQLIGRLQHLNLVRLLAWCVESEEKMLVYEYLENRSLDFYIFDKNQSSKLNWRIRFDIIKGIANGLRYIHEESRLKVVHRDLKASNILIDKNMTPKISDFGLARIFGREETDASTINIAGTRGYMSPEYLMEGIYSMKSDVFSFGILLLEIISGKMNRGIGNSDGTVTTLVRFVWSKWVQGKSLEIVDPTLSGAFAPTQVQQCIRVALACVQDQADDRPLMSSAISVLRGETNFQSVLKEPLGYVKNTN